MKKIAILLSIILFSSFCSLFRPKVAPYPKGVVFPVEKDTSLSYEGEILSFIQEEGGLIYFSTRSGKVYCIDGLKKEISWKIDIPAALASPPYVSNSHIYVHDDKNTLYCADLAGGLLWKKTLEGKISSGIAQSGKQVYVGTENGFLFALDSETGKEFWQCRTDMAPRSNLVVWRDKVLFGCDDNNVYFVDKEGRPAGSYQAEAKTGKTLAVIDDFLYFGTEDRYLHCVNLSRRKSKWKIRAGGAAYVAPVAAGKRIFFLCWNCVLYCLDRKSGTILWWNSIPSRSYYQVDVILEKVVASSFSPELVCFDVQTGESRGRFEAPQEIKSNPVWLSPYLLIPVRDPEETSGELLFLKKSVKVNLFSQTKFPAKPNEEITFRAKATGFYLPKYEFYLSRYDLKRLCLGLVLPSPQQEREVVQKSSDLNTLGWFPEAEGLYSVRVLVVDEKETAQDEKSFLIQKEDVRLSLSASADSPQKIGQAIVFTANFSGLNAPRLTFHLSRLEGIDVVTGFPVLILEDEKVDQKIPNEKSWTWNPEKPGLYWIKAIAQDNQESATASMAFVIEKD